MSAIPPAAPGDFDRLVSGCRLTQTALMRDPYLYTTPVDVAWVKILQEFFPLASIIQRTYRGFQTRPPPALYFSPRLVLSRSRWVVRHEREWSLSSSYSSFSGIGTKILERDTLFLQTREFSRLALPIFFTYPAKLSTPQK